MTKKALRLEQCIMHRYSMVSRHAQSLNAITSLTSSYCRPVTGDTVMRQNIQLIAIFRIFNRLLCNSDHYNVRLFSRFGLRITEAIHFLNSPAYEKLQAITIAS